MPSNPLDVYQSIEKDSLSGRDLEASALANAASKLAAVQQSWDADGHGERLMEALRFNQHLWTLFQTELAADSNPIPAEIKQNLLSLSAFVDKRTFEIMSFPEPSKLDILININNNIAAGLRSEVR